MPPAGESPALQQQQCSSCAGAEWLPKPSEKSLGLFGSAGQCRGLAAVNKNEVPHNGFLKGVGYRWAQRGDLGH